MILLLRGEPKELLEIGHEQRPLLVHESPARYSGGLGCAGAGAVLRRGNCVWNPPRVEGSNLGPIESLRCE